MSDEGRTPLRQAAERLFPGCAAHAEAAAAVHAAVEEMSAKHWPELVLEETVGGALGYRQHRSYPAAFVAEIPKLRDFIAELEKMGALEWADGSKEDALDLLMAQRVRSALLGPALAQSTWTPETVWVRALRAIVNERVRRSGGCTCGEPPSL